MAKFWGDALSITSVFVTLPVAAAKGTWEAVNGRSFEAGMESVWEPVQKACEDFGDEHHDTINKVVGTVALGFAGAAGGDAYKRLKGRS